MNKINVGVINLIMSEKLKRRYFGRMDESKENFGLSIDRFLHLIKESPILRTEFKVLNNIENKTIENEVSATRYIDNNIKLFEIYTLNEVLEESKKLKNFYDASEGDYINDYKDKIKLYESINNLIIQSLNDYEDVDVDTMHESFNHVLEHIKKPKNKKTNENIIDLENINESIIKIAIEKFNNKYKSLSENDKDFLYNLIETNEEKKKELFEEYKKENIRILNETNENHLIDRKHKALEKIKSMNYNKDTIDDDLIKLYELKTGLI